MKTLAIDIETYSSAIIQKTGVYKYAEAEDFEILLFGYAFDDDPVKVVDLTVDSIPWEVEAALQDKDVLKTAFNANFERTCLSRMLRKKLSAEQWSCTAVMAKELGLPGSLADVGKVLGLEQQKLETGSSLIKYFCVPCKPTKINGGRTRNLPSHAPDKWKQFIEYNRRDVEVERNIRNILSKYPISPTEKELYNIDQRINDRGVLNDIELTTNAIEFDRRIKETLTANLVNGTGLDNPNSVLQFKFWLESKLGIELESVDKKALKQLKATVTDPLVIEMIELKEKASKTSTKKYITMRETAGSDNRIRGLTQFYGAGRTGRWAGRLVQMQNLPQNKIPDADLDAARQLVKGGHFEAFGMLFDDTTSILSQLIRTAFIPKQGFRFIVSDFSAIEARVIAWLADEQWRLDVFNTHGKIYEASAEQMFHLEPGSVKKGDPMRQKGKIAELALGYGGSVGALKAMGALEMGLNEDELKPLVDSWRSANQKITHLWWSIDRLVKDCIRSGLTTKWTNPNGVFIGVRKQGPLLRIQLPSGRELSYVKPRVDAEDRITYEGTIQEGGGWGRIETYGPKIVENIIQAIARDCLAEAMIRLEKMGFPVVFHVHDEVILEVPKDVSSAEEIAAIMAEPIAWAPGLPLKADAYECEYYRKD